MHGNADQHMNQLGIAVEIQREAAGHIVLRLFQLFSRRAFRHECRQHLLCSLQCFFAVLALGGEADGERAFLFIRNKAAGGAIGIAMLVAQHFHQTAVEPARTQYIIAHHQWEIVGVVIFQHGQANLDAGLLAVCERQPADFATFHVHGRRCGVPCRMCGQLPQGLLHQFFRAFTVHIAHQQYDGIVLRVILAVELFDVAQLHGADALLAAVGGFAVWVAAVIQTGVFALGQITGIGLRLFQRYHGLVLQAGQNGGIKTWRAHGLPEQFGGFVQCVGAA